MASSGRSASEQGASTPPHHWYSRWFCTPTVLLGTVSKRNAVMAGLWRASTVTRREKRLGMISLHALVVSSTAWKDNEIQPVFA